MNYDVKPFFKLVNLTEMISEGTGISYRYQFLFFLDNLKSSFSTQEDNGHGAIEYKSMKEKLLELALIIVAHIISLRINTAMQLESTPRFTKQLQHLENLKSRIHITDLLKVQLEPFVTNITKLSSHPQQRRQLLH